MGGLLAENRQIQVHSASFTENSRTTTILRDLLNDTFSNIYVNDEAIYDEVCEYVALIAPEQEKIVKLYKGTEPIFDYFEVTRQIKASFGKNRLPTPGCIPYHRTHRSTARNRCE